MNKVNHISTHGFSPVIDKESKMLILGSFPSVKSRADKFFYMHPQNRFWDVLAKVFNDNSFLSENITIKINTLKKHNIALYDVIESCDIINSQDSTISNVEPTNIKKLIQNTNIKQIYLNGKKAYDLFKKYNPKLKSMGCYLPSTSSANARYRLNDLIHIWKTNITENTFT